MLLGLRGQLLLTGLLLILISVASPALAKNRVALVIGNGAYKARNQLVNPPSDAHLISKALNKAQFEKIETKINLGIAEFRQALRTFRSEADGAEVALVYFAGHGIEANGANWLIPTDAELADDRDLDYDAIKADLVLQALQGARMRVLVLDACRNNPFGRNWRASVRSTTNGLAKIEADDVLVLFAAAPGRTAVDGTDLNSPFAEALAKRLPEPGLAIQLLGGSVRDDVLDATGGNQRPYVSASITGKPFYLVPAEQVSAPSPTIPQSGWSTAEREWQYVKDTKDIRLLEAFKEKHKADPFYVRLAEARIEELKKQLPAGAGPPKARTAPSALAEADRKANLSDITGAIADYDEAIRLDPKLARAFWGRGISYTWKDDDTRAIADFDEAIRLNPKLAGVFFERGKAHARKGDDARAIADLDEALRIDPKFTGAFFERGKAHARKGDDARAIADLDEAIRLNSKLADAFIERGNAYSRKGASSQALEDYRRALELDPANERVARLISSLAKP
jgi:uncharacterized caspase-like protein/Tfp pilus assembly protein PilF